MSGSSSIVRRSGERQLTAVARLTVCRPRQRYEAGAASGLWLAVVRRQLLRRGRVATTLRSVQGLAIVLDPQFSQPRLIARHVLLPLELVRTHDPARGTPPSRPHLKPLSRPLARESHDLATNSHKLATNSRRTRATLVRGRDDLVIGSREDVRRSQLTRRNRATSRQVAAPRGSSRPPREVGNYYDERVCVGIGYFLAKIIIVNVTGSEAPFHLTALALGISSSQNSRCAPAHSQSLFYRYRVRTHTPAAN